MAREIETEIIIHASARLVWQVLTDLEKYREWNPLIRDARGELVEGALIDVYITPPQLARRNGTVEILKVDTERELHWLGKVLCRGILDGDHQFILEPMGAGSVRVFQRERFAGVLVPLVARWLIPNMRRGFEELNEALRVRVASLATSP